MFGFYVDDRCPCGGTFVEVGTSYLFNASEWDIEDKGNEHE